MELMTNKRIILGSIIAAGAASALWAHFEKAALPSALITSSTASVVTTSTPKVIAPARVIPSDVNANMQEALAARQQKLAQLAKGK